MKLRDRLKLAWRCFRHGKPTIRIIDEVKFTDAIVISDDIAVIVEPGGWLKLEQSCFIPEIFQVGGTIDIKPCNPDLLLVDERTVKS